MPTQSPQQSAIAGAQALAALMTLAKQLRDQGAALLTARNSEGWDAIWAALPTAALSADGSLGAADGTPNNAHPINGFGLFRSKAQLTDGAVFLSDFVNNFCGNVAQASATNRNAWIDDLAS
jgi:hypothetical protein